MTPRVKFGFERARKSFAAAAEIIRSGRGKHLQRSGKTGENYSNTLRSPYSHPAKAVFATFNARARSHLIKHERVLHDIYFTKYFLPFWMTMPL